MVEKHMVEKTVYLMEARQQREDLRSYYSMEEDKPLVIPLLRTSHHLLRLYHFPVVPWSGLLGLPESELWFRTPVIFRLVEKTHIVL
jgi:hypothetical protein